MAKKDLYGTGAASADIFDTIAKAGTQNTQNTDNIVSTPKTDNTQDKKNGQIEHAAKGKKKAESAPKKPVGRPPVKDQDKYYRFNLSMPIEYRDYLKRAAFEVSSPEKIVTITEYMCWLVKQDMEKHEKK